MIKASALLHRQKGLDDKVFAHAIHVAEETLAGRRDVTRGEFLTALEQEGIATGDQRGYSIIAHLAQTGVLCWGPIQDSQQALVLCGEWLPFDQLEVGDSALRQLAVRYFAGHGPATVKDLAYWSKLTLTDCRAALDEARDEMVELQHDGDSYWITRSSYEQSAESIDKRAFVLAPFDEYVLGYRTRGHAMTSENEGKAFNKKNGTIAPMVVIGGEVVGVLRPIKGSKFDKELEAFRVLGKKENESVGREVEKYRAFYAS